VSHYYKFCFVQEIVEKRELFKNVLLRFFEEKVKHLLKVSNCVVDFVIINENQAMVVEINPFVWYRKCISNND
jgi:hypothetical protein